MDIPTIYEAMRGGHMEPMERNAALWQCIVEATVRLMLDAAIEEIRGWEHFQNITFPAATCEWKIGTDWYDNLQAECWLIRPEGKELAYSTIPHAVSLNPYNVYKVYESLPILFDGLVRTYPKIEEYWGLLPTLIPATQ